METHVFCFYASISFLFRAASAAGFDTDPLALKCVPTIEYPPNPGTCPVVPTGTVCEYSFNPQICGSGSCFYTNTCESTAAGASECRSANCPSASEGVMCTMEYMPVVCEPFGCEYSNQCQATASGYSEAMCRLADCPAPAADRQCTRDIDPYECTGGCVYDNPCVATSAGFDLASSCAPVPDPTPPESCPAPDANVACTMEVDEVICRGADGVECFYVNQCLGNAAGYNPYECYGQYCIPPRTPEQCPSPAEDDDPQLCGPYGTYAYYVWIERSFCFSKINSLKYCSCCLVWLTTMPRRLLVIMTAAAHRRMRICKSLPGQSSWVYTRPVYSRFVSRTTGGYHLSCTV